MGWQKHNRQGIGKSRGGLYAQKFMRRSMRWDIRFVYGSRPSEEFQAEALDLGI